jgi:hypothetical protein
VRNVTDMSGMFRGYHSNTLYTKTIFNGDITSWQTDSLTNIARMFQDDSEFNQDISTKAGQGNQGGDA